MEYNKQIKCSVLSCKHYCSKHCKLEKIKVCNCEDEEADDASSTMCDSFECEE